MAVLVKVAGSEAQWVGIWPGKPQYIAMAAGTLARWKRFENTLAGFDRV
jgi:hypothetical protein